MADKVKTAAEVVRTIRDGSHIALGGFAINRCCVAVAHELIRQGKKNLTLSQGVVGFDTDLLVGAGSVSHLIMGGGSLDRFGPVHCVNRARETRSVDAHDYSSLTICFRYLAGALGLSFIPVKSLLASEILERLEAGSAAKDVKRMKCPFTGEEYLLLRALTPDVSFVHVQISDAQGNSQIHGARWENEEQAKAGKRVVVITEELVPTEYIQRYPAQTIIPAHRVEAVIHQPFGAHPSAVFQCYDFDADHLKFYVNHSKSIERFPEYLNTYVLGTKDHWEYLEKVGGLRRMNELKADRILGY
jgi:glutaconate CoA-transferase subunit A